MSATAAQLGGLSWPRGEARVSDGWSRIVLVLAVGYLCPGRSFAYLGLPWMSLYLGEIALAAFLLMGPRTKQGRWIQVAQRLKELQHFEKLLLLLLAYGIFEAARGILAGYPALTAARDTAFNYYPLFLFLGAWASLRDRDLLRRVARALAWWNGCYGLAYVLLLNQMPWTMPGTAHAASLVPIFTEPLGSGIALLGLFAFEPKLRRVWYLVGLNTLVMMWVQMRAEWVGFAVGLAVLAWITKRMRKLFLGGALIAVLLAGMYAANVNLPSPKGRGGRIAVSAIVARAVAPFSRELASRLAPPIAVQGYAGTAEWRLIWWAAIWQAVHANIGRSLVGFGYGYPIGQLNPYIEPGTFIQTPHNDFFYALGFSGWIGVALFVLLQAEVLRLLLRGYRATGQVFGLMCWAALLAVSLFGDFFESPMGAIPFYLFAGMALAPALVKRRSCRTFRTFAPMPSASDLAGV